MEFTAERADRAAGAMLGVHVGDVIGAPWEFMSDRAIQQAEQRASAQLVGVQLGGGPFDWAPGEPTDDTQQTLAVAKAMLAAAQQQDANPMGHKLVAAAERALVEWYESGPGDVGATTSAALSARSRGEDPRLTVVRLSLANGSIMRAVPAALIGNGLNRSRLARSVSALTHPNADVGDLVADYSDLVAELVRDGFTDDVDGERLVRCGWAREMVSTAPPRNWLGTQTHHHVFATGTAATALRMGWWALQLSREVGPWRALVEVVRAGGDTDTTAAVAGGLLGAAYGTGWLHDGQADAVRRQLWHGPQMEALGMALLAASGKCWAATAVLWPGDRWKPAHRL